jgi:Cupredoxin-like domain
VPAEIRIIQYYDYDLAPEERKPFISEVFRIVLDLKIGNVMRAVVLAIVLAAFGVPSAPAFAQEFNLVIRNHKFEPEEIRVPAGKRVSIYVSNEDATPEEFDSTALKVEKIIPGKSKGLVRIGPLDPGRYEFMGEFHADTAKGVVVAE